MTSRSASRNATTQVDEDLRSFDRSSPPPRGYIEITGIISKGCDSSADYLTDQKSI